MILAFRRPLANNLMNILLPFAAGGLIAGFPTLFYVVRDFESFMFNNLYYFESQIEFRRSAEGSVGVYAMTLKEKLAYAQRIWAQGPNVIIMVCTSAAVIAAAMTPGFRDRQVQLRRPAFGLAILAFIGATVMSFQVTPMWPQYLIPQMVMAIVLGAAAFGTLDASARRYATSTLVATALVAVLTMPTARLTVHLPKMFDRDQWTGVAVHRGAAELRRQMRIAGFDDPATRIATLAPILPLEAGFSIFNELASGPFFYRSGNFMTAEQRAQFNVVSMDTIEDFLTEHRPAAVLVGAYEPTRPEYFTEVPLIRFAEEAGYRRVDLGPFPGGNILYLRPAAAIDAHGQTDVDRSPGA
ncbi:MAG: hypothetical protein EA405_03330 [Rhodospirillales bacterium]|nr:MAG: hypothetical protein EA405_03330 [Rhodospirillales bacterium]